MPPSGMWTFQARIVLESLRRLLLRHAVEGPKPPNQVAGVDRDDLAKGKSPGQRVKSDPIVGIVEDRNEYAAVGYIEICIAGREPALFEDYRRRHWKLDNIQSPAI